MPAKILRRAWPWLGVCLFVSAGCSPPEEVRTYTAKRETPTPTPLPPPAPVADGTDKSRMLGVIIPVGPDASRYIKFSGAIDRVTAAEVKFEEFVAGVRLTSAAATPTYKVPAGWTENPPRQFVAKSFTVGPAGTPQVTLSDAINGSLLANVNRWRVEVGLKEVTAAELPKSVTEITLGDTKAYRIDFRGPAVPTAPGSGRMRGPAGPK